ncbi:DUF3726 domain-containing protein [Primorskyibacter aestuariivivens]|uniref:DUF3726 domain-containing protein n=1 Tax=Primorskyibacter aestuariivivens TaxID=1888912 RepID=UPI002300B8D6|nr:DUF3726 domain-containing protein [Primorskyibacter aestuariivivens]MDA7427939.1 DUF3726 domain-containing protein [Primorskyibacter aestuariivivens]
MSWSLVETEALARKAARGGGYSWGQAEDAGAAVRWLEARGLPGAAALADLLEMPGDAGSCPIALGTSLCDRGEPPAPMTIAEMRAPVLLVPFLVWVAKPDDMYLAASLGAARIILGPDGVWLDDVHRLPERAGVQISGAKRPAAPPIAIRDRCSCGADVMEALDRFALRTYAPATERSRLAGAGAGLSDND